MAIFHKTLQYHEDTTKKNVKQGDYLTTAGRTFLVLLCEDPGNLGATGLIYLEERNDLK